MAHKEFEEEDPMQMNATEITCDEKQFDEMVEAIIEEYLMMGWNNEQILKLFNTKFFQLTHSIRLTKGEDYVRNKIQVVRDMWSPKN